MRKAAFVFLLSVFFVGVLDVFVALTLTVAEQTGKLSSLVRYFDYGRSVPGKLAKWEKTPDARGNLYDVAWRSDIVQSSNAAFEKEDLFQGPVLRSYGMSFVNNIIRSSVDIDPKITWDNHAGPSAPPNFTYALFQDDREARREGDIVVLGILSSSLGGMAAMSNSTWVFEQPAPFTYPIYWPDGHGLRRVEPILNSSGELRALSGEKRRLWEGQLRDEDHFFGLSTYGLAWLDRSPFLRLVRRSLATSDIAQTKAEILEGGYPYADVLQHMVKGFAQMAREDGQRPIVMLVQSRDPTDPNVLELVRPALDQDKIPHFATIEHFDPSDRAGFLSDGHYAPRVDHLFGEQFIKLISSI